LGAPPRPPARRGTGPWGGRPAPADHPGGEGMSAAEPAWGVDSEYGRLQDVLLCDPENFRWLITSAITRATLEAGFEFDGERAAHQHDALVSAYEAADVRCHFLE